MAAVEVSLRVLEAVGELQPAGVSDVARHLGLPKTTTHRTLHALTGLGWLRSAGDSPKWQLTGKVLELAGHFTRTSDLRELALGPMEALGRRTGETIHLTVRQGHRLILLHKVDSVHPVRTWSYVGGTSPMHATSSGKAILSTLPADEVRALFDDVLEAFTGETVATLDALAAELEQVRSQGFAINRGQWLSGVASVAAPIRSGSVASAALSVSMPAQRADGSVLEEYGLLVRDAASSIKL